MKALCLVCECEVVVTAKPRIQFILQYYVYALLTPHSHL